jgi:tetratricopeptide (TPR) repeat protein
MRDMRTPLVQPAAPTPTATVSEFIATLAIVLAAIVGLVLFDTALARVDIAARKTYAAREFEIGKQFIGQGKIEAGLEHLRTATMLDSDNPAYGIALAQTTLADGRPDEAAQMLVPLLERNDTAGATNLAIARVLVNEGRVTEAKSYYHRAIYGFWPKGTEKNRTTARFELIDLLARENATQELLAELLPIQDDSTNDAAQRKRIAHFFVVAGSPARAVTIFRDLLRREPRDPESYVGLAEAALSIGDFGTARTDLLAAQKLMPDDSSSLHPRLALTDSVISLDPTQSGLALPEQVRRAKNLLQMTLTSVRKCLGVQAPQVAVALDSATLLLVSGAAAGQAQSVEQNLSLAEQLWGLRRSRCAKEGNDGALALIHNRISQ